MLRLPRNHQKHIRTTNLIERTFVEQRRRTKIIPQFLTEKSCLKLVFSVLYRATLNWRRIKISQMDIIKITQLKKDLGIILDSQPLKKSVEVFNHA